MLKSIFALGFLVAATALAPVQAADMTCSDGDMAKMQGMVDKMGDAAKKDAATKEMGMASDAMKAKDDKGCMMHMGKVQGMM